MPSLEGPPSSDYISSSSQIWFSYLPNFRTFNVGFLGVNDASIAGILHLRSTLEKPLLVNKIKIKFTGEETKGWSEPNPNNEYKCVENFEQICNINVHLWESQEEVGSEAKKWNLPFKIPLPKDLPPSMIYPGQNNKLFVKYQLSAIIYFGKFYVMKKKIISVKLDLIKYNLRPENNPPIKICGNDPRYFGYDVHLDKTTYGLGETVKLSMKLLLFNHKIKFKEIDIYLKEYITYESSTFNKDKSNYILSKVVKGDIVHNSSKGDEWSADILLSLPSRHQNGNKPLLCDIIRTDVASIQHKIKIKFKVNKTLFGVSSINIDKQIYIENFVSEEMHTDLALAFTEEVNTFLFSQNRSKLSLLKSSNSDKLSPPALTPGNLSIVTSYISLPRIPSSRSIPPIPPSFVPSQDNLSSSLPDISTPETTRNEYDSSDSPDYKIH